jgi:hypothetical protein
MIRSLFVKGLEAITVQAISAARQAGCYDEVYESLSGSYKVLGWPEYAEYQFERMMRHGVRRAAEMRESANSMRELGFANGGALADAIAAWHDEVGGLGCSAPQGADLVSHRGHASRGAKKPGLTGPVQKHAAGMRYREIL